jgi:hypothetical protein
LAGNGNFQQRDVAFVDYIWVDKSSPSKRIDIRWNLPGGRPVDLPVMSMTCKRFIASTNDTHHITFNTGSEVITIELPPYAGDDTGSIPAAVEAFLDQSAPAVLDYILTDTTDELVSSTLREAVRFAKEHHSRAIELALRIRCASFCAQGWGSITGSESLGIGTVDFNERGKCGYAAYDRGQDKPLPLSIDHQLDVALLLIIKKYQKELLGKLGKMIFGKARKPWYAIFLTVFVLLSNLEYVHGGGLSFYHAQMKTVSPPLRHIMSPVRSAINALNNTKTTAEERRSLSVPFAGDDRGMEQVGRESALPLLLCTSRRHGLSGGTGQDARLEGARGVGRCRCAIHQQGPRALAPETWVSSAQPDREGCLLLTHLQGSRSRNRRSQR